MDTSKGDVPVHIPHKIWCIATELEGLALLFQNQSLSSPNSLRFDEGMEGIGRILGRNAKRLRKLSRIVDKLEVDLATKEDFQNSANSGGKIEDPDA